MPPSGHAASSSAPHHLGHSELSALCPGVGAITPSCNANTKVAARLPWETPFSVHWPSSLHRPSDYNPKSVYISEVVAASVRWKPGRLLSSTINIYVGIVTDVHGARFI